MYKKDTIRRLFGPGEIKRIEARHKGGVSGQKGTRFEDYFAIYKLTDELSLCYHNSVAGFKDTRRTKVRAQVFAIIDDVVIEVTKPRIVEHYQLKNVGKLGWTAVAEDFVRQKKLCDGSKHSSRLFLVVPTQSLKLKLARTNKWPQFANIMVFPYKHLPLLVQTHQPFRQALVKLSPFDAASAENEKLLSLAKFISGHWLAANNKVSIKDLALAMDAEAGAFCRPMKGNRPIPSDIKQLLRKIPDFKWAMHKGFLFWSHGRLDSGRYPHHCRTRDFERLLARIRRNRPVIFDEIERELR